MNFNISDRVVMVGSNATAVPNGSTGTVLATNSTYSMTGTGPLVTVKWDDGQTYAFFESRLRRAPANPEQVQSFDLIAHTLDAMSEDGEDSEYDRALFEACCVYLGVPTSDNVELVGRVLRAVKAGM